MGLKVPALKSPVPDVGKKVNSLQFNSNKMKLKVSKVLVKLFPDLKGGFLFRLCDDG